MKLTKELFESKVLGGMKLTKELFESKVLGGMTGFHGIIIAFAIAAIYWKKW